nr:hypothetical protein [Tanacetum cinerariifolium]
IKPDAPLTVAGGGCGVIGGGVAWFRWRQGGEELVVEGDSGGGEDVGGVGGGLWWSRWLWYAAVVAACGGEWYGGSNRSGDGDRFWVRRKRSPEKFSGGGGGGQLVAGGGRWWLTEIIEERACVCFRDWYSLTPSRDKLERLEKANACINESLTTSVQKLLNSHERGKAKLTQRDENIFVLQKKLRLLEEPSKVFHEVQAEFDSEIFHDTQDNSEKDLILGLQTQLKETAELVVRFADEKYFVSKENKSLKVEIKNFKSRDETTNHFFEEDKRMFLAKNEFLGKVSSSVQKEYNDLMAFNDVLRQSLETKFNLLQHDKSLEQTIEIIDKQIGDTVKCFDAEKKVFEKEISKVEKVLEQRVKDFDKVNT